MVEDYETLISITEACFHWEGQFKLSKTNSELVNSQLQLKQVLTRVNEDYEQNEERELAQPRLELVLAGMSRFIYEKITSSTRNGTLFDEKNYIVGGDFNSAVTRSDIELFLNKIMKGLELGVEFAIVATMYVDLLETCGVHLSYTNWRCVVLVSFLTATKVWFDENVWNIDFIDHVFPTMRTNDLCRLESLFLKVVGFKLIVRSSAYNSYEAMLMNASLKKDFGSFINRIKELLSALKELFKNRNKSES